MGRAWVSLMLVVALSSFLIRDERDGAFGPIHILSVVTLISLVSGIRAIHSADRVAGLREHRRTMQGLYAAALLIAGGFTLLPQRLLGRLMTEASVLPHVLIVSAMVGSGLVLLVRTYRPAGPKRGDCASGGARSST